MTIDPGYTIDSNMDPSTIADLQAQHPVGGASKDDIFIFEEEVQDKRNIESNMYYLESIPLYETEKPYMMRYQPQEDIPQSNFQKCETPMIAINMQRADVGPFKFDECGFELIELHSKMSFDNFYDNSKIQSVYIQEVREGIKKAMSAKFWVLDYAVCIPCESC